MEPTETRQTSILREFNFKCECIACVNQWPIFRQLKIKDFKLMKYARKVNDEMVDILKNHSKLIKSFRNSKSILNEHYHNYPSMELCIIQKTFATFLLKLAANENIYNS